MHIAIDILDEIASMLPEQAGGASRAVLEAVAIEAYRSGTITTAQAQQMLGRDSRWKTEELLQSAEALHDYTMVDLAMEIAAIRNASSK